MARDPARVEALIRKGKPRTKEEGPEISSPTLPNVSSQGNNPNTALTRPQTVRPLTLIGSWFVMLLFGEEHLALLLSGSQPITYSRHFGGQSGDKSHEVCGITPGISMFEHYGSSVAGVRNATIYHSNRPHLAKKSEMTPFIRCFLTVVQEFARFIQSGPSPGAL